MKKILLLLYLVVYAFPLYPQHSDSDSMPRHTLSTIVVTADRFQNRIITSTASISTIAPAEAKAFPLRNLPDILSIIPGISVFDKSGLGFAPVISMRGFYGGGEAEYALVVVDGVQINDLETGLINWNFLNISNIESIEAVRGGNSALYGDAAIGGIINITTQKRSKSFFAGTGSFGSYSAGLNYSFLVKDNPLNFYLSSDLSEGFRNNSGWFNLNFGGSYFAGLEQNAYLKFSTSSQITDTEIPGPVPGNKTGIAEEYSLSLFRSDRNKEGRFNFIAEYSNPLSWTESIKFQIGYKNKTSKNTATFTNSVPIVDPQSFNPIGIYDTSLFGDTKRRDLQVNEIRLSANYYSELTSIKTRSTAGADWNSGFYTSRYFNIFNGFEEDYHNSFSERNEQISDAQGSRQDYAIYVNGEVNPSSIIKLSAGLRFDQINDSYESISPDSLIEISNSAVSPKAGLNILISESENFSASIYANFNRSFKAATIDQLTNLNQLDFAVFVPAGESQYIFFPFKAAPFANSKLKPQKSTSYEIGSYSSHRIFSDFVSELSAAVYQSDVTDEIDFDLLTFRYGNIEKARHRGFEGGLKLRYKSDIAGFVNYAVSEVKFRAGSYEGNLIKGIPKNVLSAGININNIFGFYSGIIFSLYGDAFLDDENTQSLSGFNVTDFRIGYKSGILDLQMEIKNVFDKKYSPTGYLLNGIQYLYPAAGRAFSGRVSVSFK